MENEEFNPISGVKFDTYGKNLIISDLVGNIRVFDVEKQKSSISYQENCSRVGSLSVYDNLLLTGNKQG